MEAEQFEHLLASLAAMTKAQLDELVAAVEQRCARTKALRVMEATRDLAPMHPLQQPGVGQERAQPGTAALSMPSVPQDLQRGQRDAVVTPAPAKDAPGQSVVFADRSPSAEGCATLVPTQFRAGAERTDTDYPFVLTTGHVLEHWNTGAMTRHTSMLDAITPEALKLADSATVRLETHHGVMVASEIT